MSDSLLPPNATEQELAIEAAMARLGDVPVPIRALWDVDACPVALLPWLAWAMSVDTWSAAWPEDRKRAVIASSFEVHKRKGTIGSVERAVAAVWGDARVLEWFDYAGDPYKFRVHLQVEIEGFDLSTWDEVEEVVEATKNARSHLETVAVFLTSRGHDRRAFAVIDGETTTVDPYLVTELSADLPSLRAMALQDLETTVINPL